MITILTHLRTEAYQSIDHFWGVPYETQNKVRLPSKAIMDTHLSGWLRCGWAINRGVCPGLLQGLWFCDLQTRFCLALAHEAPSVLSLPWAVLALVRHWDSEPEFWKLVTRWHPIFVKSLRELALMSPQLIHNYRNAIRFSQRLVTRYGNFFFRVAL